MQAPAGNFVLLMRMYSPGPQVLTLPSEYRPPAVQRVSGPTKPPTPALLRQFRTPFLPRANGRVTVPI